MSRFRRELRYLVFKLKDIDRYLSPREWETLVSIENKIIAARDKERRPQLSTVVVERDWPEFEIVWGMIEARMLGVKNKYKVEIEELQTELNEQCRLLGMSAERELKLIAERDQFRDGMLTLGTELRAIEAALDDERINLTHTAAQVAAEMRGKINELHAEIERLRAEIAASVPAPIEGAKYMSNDWYYAEGWNDCRHAMLDAQTAPSVPDGWQPIETAPKDGTHVLLANKSGTRVADGMYGNYGVWSWPYVMVEPAYWRPIPAAPGAQENNDG